MTLDLSSPAFSQGSTIPAKYTCAGEDISPPLEWGSIPDGAESVALICVDPDAPSGMFTHWVVYNIPPGEDGLAEGISSEAKLPSGAMQGLNDFGNVGYGGPCPPPGPAHHYYFRIYAVNTVLDLPPGASRGEVMESIRNNTLGSSELMGLFARG